MYKLKGLEEAPRLESDILTPEGESIPSKVPEMPPVACPQCRAKLYEARPLTVRLGLLRQLESLTSKEATETRELCRKLLKASDPLELENAELTRLKAAVEANGFGYRDWINGLLKEFLKTATRQGETSAKAGEAAAGGA